MVETDLEIGVINKKFNQELLRLRHELKLRSLSTGSTAKNSNHLQLKINYSNIYHHG